MLTLGRNLSKDKVWWGWSQIHKWRFNRSNLGKPTHIDLGPLSVYNLKSRWWYLIGWLIIPLRIWYHWRYVYRPIAQAKNLIAFEDFKDYI